MKRIYQVLLPIFLLLAFVVPRSGAQTIVAEYPFSGNANDVSSDHNNATVHSASLTQDRFGRANQAYLFDGVKSHLDANNASQLNSATASVSFWIRADELPAQGEVYLLSFGGWQDRWKISLPAHGKPIWTTHATSCCSDLDAGGGNELVVGSWTHLVMVHDGAKDFIYVNGVLTNSKDSPGDLGTTTHPLGIGYDPIDADYFFNGALDDIIIYSTPLNGTEVANLYAEQSVPPVVTNDLVANYTFTKNFRDESAYGNNASGKNVEFTTDRFGFGNSAVSFNGEDAGVTAPNSSVLNSATTTISFWVKVNSLPVSGEAYLLSFGGWQERCKISLPGHGKMVWTTHATSCCSDLDAGGGNELVPGTWTHAAFVHDGTEDKIFVNGVLVASKASPGDLANTTHPLGIGYDPIDVANYFDGSLDDVQIYNYALTDTEINDLYTTQNSAVIDPDPLVLNIPMAGDLKDVSQFKNDAKSDNAQLTYDRFGYANNAVAINPTDQTSITVDNSKQYNSDWTSVSFWVKLNELPVSGEVYLMSFGGWQERWKISLPSHGKVVWTTYATSCCSDMDAGAGNELVPGAWTHVVTVHGTVQDKIYINGVLVASKDVGGPLHHTKYPLGIGWDPIDKGSFINGDIDEVRIYTTPLTDQQVADLYAEQNATPNFPGDVVADYALNANAKDDSPYHNNGDVSGAIASLDRFGRSNHAMNFNGSAGVTADNSPQLNSGLATVSFWVNVNALPVSGEAYLMSFGGWQERWKISLPGHGKVVWTTHATSCCSDLDAGGGNELIPGIWTHLVMVHDGVKDFIYVNGALANSKDSPGDLATTVHPLGIGYDPIDVANYFDGSLDDVHIYKTALTGPEVAALYATEAANPVEPDITAPDPPAGLEGTVSFTNVSLTWQPSIDGESGISGYNVYQDGAIVQTVEETYATITDLAPLTAYEFGVSAVDVAGNESAASFLTLTTGLSEAPDTTKPSIPSNLTISAGANSVVFSWDASTDEGGLGGYVVSVDGNYVDSLDANTISIFIGGLDPLTPYTFEVYAYDLSGNNSEIADITASTTAPVVTAEPGLVAHYKFEGDAKDATPYNNHGTIGGNPQFETVTNRPNASGMDLKFDGDADSVLVPNAVQLISDYTTVSFWIRVDGQNLADPEAYIMDFGNYDERWKISLPVHRQIVWTTNSKNTLADHFIHDMDSGAGNDLVIGFWWYVTMVHDGTDDIIYIDGTEVARFAVTGTLNSTARSLGIGNNLENPGKQYFQGALDEIKIYNKALTGDEVSQLYTLGYTKVQDLQSEIRKYVEVIYPNPTKDQLTIKHGFGSHHQDLLVRIFDQLGREVSSKKVGAKEMGNGSISLNVATLQYGVYSLNFVLDGKNVGSLPFVKQ
ncbi:MAG: LamG-like jellyroll fold domain-containing protein [Saprospiraceae bacterium]